MPTYFPDELDFIGGGDRYAYRVAQALRSQHDVTLVTFGPRQAESEAESMRHIVVRARGSDHENPIPNLGFFARTRFDVIHVYQFRCAATSLLAILGRLRRIPIVVSDVGGGGRSLMLRLQLYRFIRRFICISDFSRRILPEAVWSRAVAVKGGIDLGRFQYDPRPRQRRVLQVGRIMPHKGTNYLIEAAADDIPVVVAGRVKDPRYFQYLQKLSRGKQVAFRTDASDDEILELYRTSAVTVGPSVYRDVWGGAWPMSELLGLTMLESMAVGTPVVCTNVGGMPEYVVDGKVGYVVPPNDAPALRARILELLSDEGRAKQMGRLGCEHVKQFSWSSVAERISAEYSHLRPSG
jgi:glycosyltransferase involved in cell wall biosynthesis